MTVRSFRETAVRNRSGGVSVPVPFDPAEAWGPRDRYHVGGTIEGRTFRTTLVRGGGSWQIALGPKSGCGARLLDGQMVAVELSPEGPDLPADVQEALARRPRARSAFEGLATFYKKGWLRWIGGTKRHPDLRAKRIAEMVRLVEEGHKERP